MWSLRTFIASSKKVVWVVASVFILRTFSIVYTYGLLVKAQKEIWWLSYFYTAIRHLVKHVFQSWPKSSWPLGRSYICRFCSNARPICRRRNRWIYCRFYLLKWVSGHRKWIETGRPFARASLDILDKSNALRIRSSTALERSRPRFCTRDGRTLRL